MKWKTKILSTVLALSVMVPTASFAAGAVTKTGDLPVKKSFVQHQHFDRAQHQAIQDKMLETITKYAPESVDDWKTVFAEQEQLVKQLKEKAPDMRQRNQLPDEVKEKIQSIQSKVKNGNLTREQAREELNKLGFDKKGKDSKFHSQLLVQFREALKSNDEAKIKELIPQLLDQMKEHNQQLSAKLSKTN